MKTQLITILLFLSICSCSQLKEVLQEPETVSEPLSIATKAEVETPFVSEEIRLHFIQSSHIAMLIDGVALIDSMYVQTMTDEDMKGLSITEEEKSFSDAYVAVLNELKSQKH